MTTVTSLMWLLSCCIVLKHGVADAVFHRRKWTVSSQGQPRLFCHQYFSVSTVATISRGGAGGGGGGRFGIVGNNSEDETMMVKLPVPRTHFNNLWNLNVRRLTKVSHWLLAFFHSLAQHILPQSLLRGMISSTHFKYQMVGFVLAGSMVAILCDYVMMQRKEKQLTYLMWDAKELVPDVWDAVEHIMNETLMDQETTPTIARIKELRHRVDLQDLLSTKVNKAKALQVAGIYQNHFPDHWKKLVSSNYNNYNNNKNKNNKDKNIMASLAKRQRLLGKLTRKIARQKFTALLRPDYTFGVGRDGIDLSNNKCPTGNSGMIDWMLLQQVTEDVISNVPKEYPETWKFYTSKLYPGQTLWDRHDLVLKMVKNVQMQKSQGQVEATTNIKSSSCDSEPSWGMHNHFNRTQSSERYSVQVDDTSGRDQESTTSQISSN
jgi:hypothetical protein